jgi:RNA polymerase sigma factor (TIGR02999 family)
MTSHLDQIDTGQITELLQRIDAGDQGAIDELFTKIYDELRRIVRQQQPSAGDRELLQTTAIVNEACLRLAGHGLQVNMQNRRHLFASVNRAVQRVLIDYARKRTARKRTGDANQILNDMLQRYEQISGGDLVDLQDAIESLRSVNPRAAEVVDMRFWGGLTMQEAADLLELSLDTVKRDWRFARAFLKSELDGEPA